MTPQEVAAVSHEGPGGEVEDEERQAHPHQRRAQDDHPDWRSPGTTIRLIAASVATRATIAITPARRRRSRP